MPLSDARDVQTRPVPTDEADKAPSTYLAVTLDAKARADLEAWIDLHLSTIETQMQPVLARFQQEEDQLDGIMPGAGYPYEGAFRVNYPLTKKKVREVANRIKQAYLDSDPVWGIDLDDPALFQLAIKVEKALDTAVIHELNEEDDLSLCLFQSAKHGVGALIPNWLYHEERVRRLETWEPYDGKTLESLDGLLAFEATYPNWREEPALRKLHGQLRAGHRVEREITATVPVVNHPDFQHVESKRLRVYPGVEGYEGLRTTPLYGFGVEWDEYSVDLGG